VSRVPDAGNREHDIYWLVGPDGSRILMKWNSLLVSNQGMGGYAEARDPAGVIGYVDTDSAFAARYPYPVIGAFGKGWDDLKTLTGEFVTAAKQQTNASRQVIVSNQVDFFQDFEAAYGAGLPEQSCSFGNEWDLYCASMAEVSARVKRAVEKLRAAEALATLVSLQVPTFMDARRADRDQAWMALGLYWEHDWTANGPVARDTRAAWQREVAGQVESYADTLYADAAAALAGLIEHGGANPRFYAFNPLGWARTDYADLAYADLAPVHVVDLSTGAETPSQIVIVASERRLRILAQDVPPVGYKVFEIRPGAGIAFADAANVAGGVIESDILRVTLADRGAITSLVDKQRGNREFAQAAGGRWLNDLGPGSGTLLLENAGPVSATLVATAATPIAHTTRVSLIRGSRRVEIRNEITQNFAGTYTWGFGFNLAAPDVWHEEIGAIVRARLLADGGHYSPRNARYDWLTLNHFADMSGGGVGVTLSNADCYFFQLGGSTSSALDTATPSIAALAGGQVDGPDLGIPNQGGDTSFVQRFALQTHDAFDPVAAMRFALEHQNPFATAVITGGGAYPADTYSFLTLTNPNVLLWALKPADDGIAQAGFVARLWNLSAAAVDCTLSVGPGAIASARLLTHIETPLGDLPVNGGALAISLDARQIKTVALKLAEPATGGARMYLPLLARPAK
jgi:alpha-mannosidase